MSIRKQRQGGGQTNHPSSQGLEATTRVTSSRQSSRRSSRQSNVSRASSRGSRRSRISRASSRGSNNGGMNPEDWSRPSPRGVPQNIGGGIRGGETFGRTSRGSNTSNSMWDKPGNTGLPPQSTNNNPPLASPRPPLGQTSGTQRSLLGPALGQTSGTQRSLLGPAGGAVIQDRVLRNLLQHAGNAAAYVRPAGNYMNKNQELYDIKLEENLHDVNSLHDTGVEMNIDPNSADAHIAKEIDARATQVDNFLNLNNKLSIPQEYYDPRFKNMKQDSVVDELIQSRNFTGRMRQLRLKRARILLNSSEGVQSCVSPREGYGSQGLAVCRDSYKIRDRQKARFNQLMKLKKNPEDKVNHMIRNPTTYHINHVSSG